MRAIGLILLASLAACSGKGAGNSAASVGGATGNAQESVAQTVPANVRGKFIAVCVAQAQASAPIKVDFTPICQCSADKLLAGKSPADLAKGIPPAEAQAAAMACAKEHPVTMPTKS